MTVVITGASRGIGRALLDLYAKEGARVIGTTRGVPEGDQWRRLDVADPASAKALAPTLQGHAVELLVCNAGVYLDRSEQLEEGYAPALLEEAFAVNVTGVFLTVQALLPALARAKLPRIAIIASQMGSSTRAKGGSYIYRASKAAAVNLGRNLAHDLAPRGIAVGIYHPGWVRTDMGGTNADLSVQNAALGLKARFDALSLETTGAFETWDGRDHPY